MCACARACGASLAPASFQSTAEWSSSSSSASTASSRAHSRQAACGGGMGRAPKRRERSASACCRVRKKHAGRYQRSVRSRCLRATHGMRRKWDRHATQVGLIRARTCQSGASTDQPLRSSGFSAWCSWSSASPTPCIPRSFRLELPEVSPPTRYREIASPLDRALQPCRAGGQARRPNGYRRCTPWERWRAAVTGGGSGDRW